MSRIESVRDIIGDQDSRLRFVTSLVGAFAAVALLLAVAGVCGAFWCDVRQRRKEIGVRLAIGADPNRIVAMVLAESGRLALAGLVLGLPAALAAGTLLRSFLYEVSPSDPATGLAVCAVLGAAVLLGAYVPARHASRINPSEVLRAD